MTIEVTEIVLSIDQSWMTESYPGPGIYYVKSADTIVFIGPDKLMSSVMKGSSFLNQSRRGGSANIDVHRFLDQLMDLMKLRRRLQD